MSKRIGPHADKDRPTPFAKWLYEHRKAKQLGQKNLAVLVEQRFGLPCDGGRISEWETGSKLPRPTYVVALKGILAPNGPEPPAPTPAA